MKKKNHHVYVNKEKNGSMNMKRAPFFHSYFPLWPKAVNIECVSLLSFRIITHMLFDADRDGYLSLSEEVHVSLCSGLFLIVHFDSVSDALTRRYFAGPSAHVWRSCAGWGLQHLPGLSPQSLR